MKKYSVLAIALSFLLFVIMANTMMISCSDDDDAEATPTPTATATPVSEPDIIPGEKMHELFINDPFSTCRDLYGEPEIRGFSNDPPDYYFLLMYFNEELLLSVLDV
ncbi:hypothetical protein ACFL27_27510 [candidate division CSSED10-310 bacterium]|uniref:Uncharacterized protein n=1 Tax=candidate division CSSED10-310 bacterium TaxID=2855610 RepID=A0ABV6Z691_UNCC1